MGGERPVQACLGLLLALLVVGVSVPAAAYRTGADLPELGDLDPGERVGWESASVSVGFASAAFDDEAFRAAVDPADARRALAAATSTWNEVPCSTFAFALSESPDVSIRVETDWLARGFDEGAAATTDVSYRVGDGEASIGGAVLTLNAALFTSGTPPNLQSVLTHELGHVLGLLHPCEGDGCTSAHEGLALHPRHRPSRVMLGDDDIEGACFLYPSECEGPACDATCRGADVSQECPWLGDPCNGEVGSLCAYGRCAADGYCSLSCERASDCASRQACQDGLCIPETARRYGETCTRGNECLSLLCVTVGEVSACTRGCDGIECPGSDACTLVDGQAVCTPPVATGCGVGRGAANRPFLTLTFFLLLVGRRRRIRSLFHQRILP